jgi:hypothetical protein
MVQNYQMLTNEQRAELEALGPENVRQKQMLGGRGRGAAVPGFKCGDITRGDIEDWLAEKYVEETCVQKSTLMGEDCRMGRHYRGDRNHHHRHRDNLGHDLVVEVKSSSACRKSPGDLAGDPIEMDGSRGLLIF